MAIFCTQMKVWDNVYNQFVKLDGASRTTN